MVQKLRNVSIPILNKDFFNFDVCIFQSMHNSSSSMIQKLIQTLFLVIILVELQNHQCIHPWSQYMFSLLYILSPSSPYFLSIKNDWALMIICFIYIILSYGAINNFKIKCKHLISVSYTIVTKLVSPIADTLTDIWLGLNNICFDSWLTREKIPFLSVEDWLATKDILPSPSCCSTHTMKKWINTYPAIQQENK